MRVAACSLLITDSSDNTGPAFLSDEPTSTGCTQVTGFRMYKKYIYIRKHMQESSLLTSTGM